MEETVTIPLSEYQVLKSGVAFINCLKECGVEDWSEYHNALVMFGELLEEEFDDDFVVEEVDDQSLSKLAQELEVDINELTDTYNEFKRVFPEHSKERLLDLTKIATIMANVSELSEDESI